MNNLSLAIAGRMAFYGKILQTNEMSKKSFYLCCHSERLRRIPRGSIKSISSKQLVGDPSLHSG